MTQIRPLDYPACQSVASLFLGKHLGSGIARDVYEYRPHPSGYVVKVERRDPDEGLDFQNIAEWELWSNSATALTKWLAPVIALSPDGRCLLQARCEPCPKHMLPKRVPSILGDCHSGNFGLYKSKVVLMDYGRNLAMTIAANAKAMRDLHKGTHR
jgi:hypothetical protein